MSNKSWRQKKNSKKMKKPAKRTKNVDNGAKQVEEVKKEEPKVLANLPDNLLLNIMKKCDEESLETMMEESPVCRKLFEDNEGQFAPPAWMSGKQFYMYLHQVRNNGTVKYNCEIEEGLLESPSKKDVSWQWIIRHLKGTHDLTFSGFKKIPYFLEPEYVGKLKKVMAEKANMNIQIYRPSSGVLRKFLKFFRGDSGRTLTLSTRFLKPISDNLDLILFNKMVTGVAFTPRQFYSSLKKFLALRQFSYLDFYCYQPIPLSGYIKEWQRGKREIDSWTFGFPHQKAGKIEKYHSYDGKSALEVDYCSIDNMPHVVLMAYGCR